MFYIASISLAFFLSFILFTKKGKTSADTVLAWWLLVIGIHLTFYYVSLIVDPYYYPYLLVSYPLPLLHGPFLYLYTAFLTDQQPRPRAYIAFHATPTLLIYTLLVPFFFLPHTERLEIFANRGRGYEWILTVQRILVLASGVVYTIVSLWLLHRHAQNLQTRFSQTEKINLQWLRYLIFGMAVVWLAVFSGNDFLIFSLAAVFVILLGYYGIKQVGIFTQANEETPAVSTATTATPELNVEPDSKRLPKTKYTKSTLTPETLQSIHKNLIKGMDEQKYFLNPELTIAELAEALSVHPNHLSQVINSQESKTFYDFVNTWRINEFKRVAALPENHRYTLLALAFECGFNSKTAFYRNFKNVTGQSPSQYLHEQRIQIQKG